jgi:predicted nucleic acid-binding protein
VPRLFLNASVWIAASGSTTGASALILTLCKRDLARAVTSRVVLLEAERNIQAKLGEDALAIFYRVIADPPMDVLNVPSPGEILIHERTVHPKDAHVLASASKERADYLLILDRKHVFTPSGHRSNPTFAIPTPGDYLRRLVI